MCWLFFIWIGYKALNGRLLVTDKLRIIWKDAVVSYIRVFAWKNWGISWKIFWNSQFRPRFETMTHQPFIHLFISPLKGSGDFILWWWPFVCIKVWFCFHCLLGSPLRHILLPFTTRIQGWILANKWSLRRPRPRCWGRMRKAVQNRGRKMCTQIQEEQLSKDREE
jgi:hypothetical protein